jgi:hypothetical protein
MPIFLPPRAGIDHLTGQGFLRPAMDVTSLFITRYYFVQLPSNPDSAVESPDSPGDSLSLEK